MERTASTTMIASRQSMVAFMIFSTPFWSPMLQIQKESRMTSMVQNMSVPGDWSMESYFSATASAVTPVNSPFAMRKQ